MLSALCSRVRPMPTIAARGVRSSWETASRKVFFIWSRASSRWVASCSRSRARLMSVMSMVRPCQDRGAVLVLQVALPEVLAAHLLGRPPGHLLVLGAGVQWGAADLELLAVDHGRELLAQGAETMPGQTG